MTRIGIPFRRTGLVGCALSGLLGCVERKPELSLDAVPVAAFDSLFPRVDAVPLRSVPDDPVGFAEALLVIGDRFVIADPNQGNVKVFDRSGTFVRAFGRPGDGPGEMRRPVGLAVADDGQLVVFDRRRGVLSFWDTAGTFMTERQVPGNWSGMTAVPGEHRLVLAGLMALGEGAARDTGERLVVHEFSSEGSHLVSYRPFRWPSRPLEASFSNFFVAYQEPVIVSGSYNTNRVHFHDRRSGREWTAAIGGPWYRTPDWSSNAEEGGGTRIQQVNRWVRRQTLMVQLFPLGGDVILAQFQAYDAEENRAYYYVLADTTGRSLVATGAAVRTQILRVVADTAYGLIADSVGDLTLEVFVVPKR
jgi:hypothetical protein